MALELVAGVNSYVTQAEADAYLAGSIQWAAIWAAYSDAEKDLALVSSWRQLERERWAGDPSAVRQALSGAVNAGGTGYAVGDLLFVAGGAIFEVVTEAAGVVATVKTIATGYYATDPTNPVVTTTSGAGDNACTLDLTMVDQIMQWPRTIADCGDLVVEPLVIPADLKAAQCELGAIFASDPSAAGSVGAGSSAPSDNLKKVEAGSAKVTYFRPGNRGPYPTVVSQLISDYREGNCGGLTGVGNAAFGTGDVSAFTCPDERYGLSRGYS